MDELKLLIEAVAGLPTITVWILLGYLVYKLCVIGSIYGVIRYGIEKFVEWRSIPTVFKIAGKAINEDVAYQLEVQITRLASTTYIHSSDVVKLTKALDIVLGEKK